jgi:hypothetical protein
VAGAAARGTGRRRRRCRGGDAAPGRLPHRCAAGAHPLDAELRADYLVEARGELLVAEVKTGEAAPSLATAATRRQLLEYHVAFAADGVLLVCPERGAIHRIEFPLGTARALAAGARDERDERDERDDDAATDGA